MPDRPRDNATPLRPPVAGVERPAACEDDAIRALVIRLSRPDRSGGRVIERAAVLASGANLEAVMRWIDAHDGKPETIPSAAPRHGLYGSAVGAPRTPQRYVLPAGALD